MLDWVKYLNDDSNTEWEAPSCRSDGAGLPYYWRLSQKLECDKIIWYENHDSSISDEYACDFETLEEAKQYIEDLEKSIKTENS